MCSWWWEEEPPETCSAIYRNKKIEKTSHLVGCTLEIYSRWMSNFVTSLLSGTDPSIWHFCISLYVVLLHSNVDTVYFLKLLVTFLPWHTLCRSNAIEEFLFFLLQVPKLDYLKHIRDPQTRWSTCVCSCGKQCCWTFSSIQLPAGQLGCHKQLVS